MTALINRLVIVMTLAMLLLATMWGFRVMMNYNICYWRWMRMVMCDDDHDDDDDHDYDNVRRSYMW